MNEDKGAFMRGDIRLSIDDDVMSDLGEIAKAGDQKRLVFDQVGGNDLVVDAWEDRKRSGDFVGVLGEVVNGNFSRATEEHIAQADALLEIRKSREEGDGILLEGSSIKVAVQKNLRING